MKPDTLYVRKYVHNFQLCKIYHDNAEMAEARGGNQTNQVVSYLDSLCKPCIRHRECELLVKEVLCTVCKNYRKGPCILVTKYYTYISC